MPSGGYSCYVPEPPRGEERRGKSTSRKEVERNGQWKQERRRMRGGRWEGEEKKIGKNIENEKGKEKRKGGRTDRECVTGEGWRGRLERGNAGLRRKER